MLEAIAVRSPIFGNPCNGADLAISRFEPFTLSGILCFPISGDDGNNFVAGQQRLIQLKINLLILTKIMAGFPQDKDS